MVDREMMMKVIVPPADPAFRAGYIARWFKQEGEVVSFGDNLCDIAIDEFMALRRTKRAALLGSTMKRRQRRIRHDYDRREGRGLVRMRVRSAESGVILRSVISAEGDRVSVGEPIAILGFPPISSPPDLNAVDDAPEARLAVDMPDAADFD